MMEVIQALTVVLPPLYLTAAFLYSLHFAEQRSSLGVTARRITVAVTLFLHASLFVARGWHTGLFPVADAWSNLSAVALGLACLHPLTSWRLGHAGSGWIVFGTVAVLQLCASAFGPMLVADPSRPSRFFFAFHIVTSVGAASSLLLSGIHGGLYLLLFRRMRGRRFGRLERRLPHLDSLASLTRRAALAGFVLLTVGLNAGIAWAHYADVEGFGYTDPWVLIMLVIWLHFGCVALSKRIPGFTAQRTSWAAACGLTLFLAASLLTALPDVSFHWGF